jgi:hypothetical protein
LTLEAPSCGRRPADRHPRTAARLHSLAI